MESIKIIHRQTNHLYLRLCANGSIHITAPTGLSHSYIMDFLKKHQAWIQKRRKMLPPLPTYSYKDGEKHLFLGRSYELYIKFSTKNSYEIKDSAIILYIKDDTVNKEILFTAAMKNELNIILNTLLHKWCSIMKVTPSSISIKIMKTRWGSCTYQTKRLHFSLDLISKPMPYIELVVVHELTHLMEPSHNRHFHELMRHYLPEYRKLQRDLQKLPKEFR